MQEFLWNLDVLIFKFFNQTLSTPWLDQVTPVLTDLAHHNWFRIAAPILMLTAFYKKFKKSGLTYFMVFFVALSVGDFVGGKVKRIFERPRPFQVTEIGTIKKSDGGLDRSFYSNHASNMFTSASYLSSFFPGGKIVFYTVATLIGLTRMHVGVHYPSDVIVGAIIGILWGLLFSYLARRLEEKMKNRS